MTGAVEMEVERRFLARRVPAELIAGPSRLVEDYYIPADADHCHLRLRRDGDRHKITKKTLITDGDLMQMEESSIMLSSSEFQALRHLPAKTAIKRRFDVPIDDGLMQIGLFEGALECQSACKRDPLSARKRDPLSRWRKVDRTRAFALRAA